MVYLLLSIWNTFRIFKLRKAGGFYKNNKDSGGLRRQILDAIFVISTTRGEISAVFNIFNRLFFQPVKILVKELTK